MSETPLIRTYGALTRMVAPMTPWLLKRRARQGKEDLSRLEERQGIAGRARPDGKLAWCHGASVGECTMLLPLIDRILEEYPDMNILVTSGTVTSANLLSERLPAQAIHQYIPLDHPDAVTRFLDHWKPGLAILAESEIWPNLLRLTHQRGIPLALLNARMSAKSIEGWQKKGGQSGKALFGMFDLILAADQNTANGLSWILDTDIETIGNLKDAAPPLPVDPKDFMRYRQAVQGRRVWCAASTHKGEDPMMLGSHQAVLNSYPDALLILAPRHPERRDEILDLIQARGWHCAARSENQDITQNTKVFLVDTIGDMGLAYRLSQISFVCGSLIEGLSGHNPLEPARLGNAVLTGPYVSSFHDTYMNMVKFKSAQRLLSTEHLGRILTDFFSDKEALVTAQKAAQDYADSRDALLDYVWDKLDPLMPGSQS